MPLKEPYPISEFLEYLKFQKRYSPHTLSSYSNDLVSFFDFLQMQYGQMPLEEIKPAFVRTWLAGLKQEGKESRTIARMISGLKTIFKLEMKRQRIQVSPMTTIVAPKLNKRLPQFVEKEDISTLLETVEFPGNWDGRTQHLLISLLYQTGIRRAELIGLKEAQVSPAQLSVKVLGKGNKERIIPVSPALMNNLQDYMAEKRKQGSGFDSVYLLVNGKGKRITAGYVYRCVRQYLAMVTTIDKKSPHVMRHSFATHLMNNGADLNAVKELLGHSSLAATQVYTHNTIEKLKDIHSKAHPKA